MADELQGPFLDSFKGLNLQNASRSMEPGYCQVLHNCVVDEEGAIVRRPGTFISQSTGVNRVVAATVVPTRTGREFFVYVLEDMSVNIVPISLFPDQSQQLNMTGHHNGLLTGGTIVKTGILVPPASNDQINFAAIHGEVTRLLIFTGTGPVVQIRFDAVKPSFSTFLPVITATDVTQFPAESYWDSTVASYYVICTEADTAHTVNSMSAPRVWSVNNLTAVPSSIEVYHISWQWWAEAYQWNGFNFVQTKNRVNVTVADQSVEVPEELTVDLDPRVNDSQQDQLLVYNSSSFSTSTLTGPSSTPSGALAHGFSQGTRYVSGAGQKLTPSSNFVTFGASETLGTISTLYFAAFRPVRFNGDTGFVIANTDVFVNDEQGVVSAFTSSSSTNFNHFYAYNLPVSAGVTSWSDVAIGGKYRYLTANIANLGLPFESTVLIVNKTHPRASLVTGEQALWYKKTVNIDGAYVPIPGIGLTSDYGRHQYHTNGTTFGNRLILVNPAGYEDQLSVSAVGDTFGTGELYSFFQVTDALRSRATDPFYIRTTNISGATVTALQSWETNLFVFFNDQVLAVSVGESFTADSYSVNNVSNYGAWNQNSVVLTNLSILYYNRFGVFDLLSKSQSEGYIASERSTAIRSLLQADYDSGRSIDHWMGYDKVADIVYVGQGIRIDSNAIKFHSRLLLLSVASNSWSTMSLNGALNYVVPVRTSRYYSYLCSGSLILQLNSPILMDFQQYLVNSSTNALLAHPPHVALDRQSSSINVSLIEPLVPGLKTVSLAYTSSSTYPTLNNPVTSSQRDDRLITSGTAQTIVPYSTISYVPSYATVTGVPVNSNYFFTCGIYTGAFWFYPQLWFSRFAGASSMRVMPSQSFPSLTIDAAGVLTYVPDPSYPGVIGLPYISIYRSGNHNFQSLGRLKRLKKLHMLFDPRCVENVNYAKLPVANASGALSLIHSDYGDDNQVAQMDVFTTRSDSIAVQALWGSSSPVYQHTQPLQGYGCDYSFSVVSVGALPFRLTGYEWDVEAQSSKRYVRGDKY